MSRIFFAVVGLVLLLIGAFGVVVAFASPRNFDAAYVYQLNVGVAALATLLLYELKVWRPAMLLNLVVCVVAMAADLYYVWQQQDMTWEMLNSFQTNLGRLWAVAVTLPLLGAVASQRSRRFAVVRWLLIVVMLGAGVLLFVFASHANDETTPKVFHALLAAGVFGTLALALLRRGWPDRPQQNAVTTTENAAAG